MIMVQLPSCPLLLSPQHLTYPPLTIAQEWEAPKAMAVAETPETGGVKLVRQYRVVIRNVSHRPNLGSCPTGHVVETVTYQTMQL